MLEYYRLYCLDGITSLTQVPSHPIIPSSGIINITVSTNSHKNITIDSIIKLTKSWAGILIMSFITN